MFPAQVVDELLVGRHMGRVTDLGALADGAYGGGRLGQEVAVVVAETQAGAVVGAVDQHGVVPAHTVVRAGVEVAGDGRGTRLVAHPVP